MVLLGIYDSKLDSFIPNLVMSHPNVAVGIRFVADSFRGSPVAQHPEDYQLMKIAEFDEMSGMITPVEPVIISACSDLFPSPVKESN